MVGEGRLIAEDQRGPVAVIYLARPPVNALNRPLLQALTEALGRAGADPNTRAVVLAAEGPQFCGGLDARELGQVRGSVLASAVACIEEMPKPVVALVQGNALGGGLELALACHGRVAEEGARLGLPEIALGLLPVAGATQRLPRLVGAPVALQMLMEGKALSAVEALAMGLVDAVVEAPEPNDGAAKGPRAEALARAIALAETLADSPIRRSLDRREGMRDALAYASAIAEARRRLGAFSLPALQAVVECVEAALLLPAEQGLSFEAAQSEAMAESPEAAGLRHAYRVERRALVLPAGVVAGPVPGRLTILGTKGPVPDLALQSLAAGLAVRLIGTDRAVLTEALQQIAARQEAMVAEGRLAPAAREADWARLTAVLPTEAVEPADLVLVSPDGPRLATLPGPALALGGQGPLVLYPAVAPGALAQLSVAPHALSVPPPALGVVVALARRLGWRLLLQGPGAALDQRLRQTLARAVSALEAQGHPREAIRAGMAAQGLLGLRPDEAQGHDSDTTGGFCLAALMVEGLRLLEEKVAETPLQVDAAALLARVMARIRGGPLFQADQIGLMALRADLRQRATTEPGLFTPPGLLDRLIAEGKTLEDLNRV